MEVISKLISQDPCLTAYPCTYRILINTLRRVWHTHTPCISQVALTMGDKFRIQFCGC